MKLALLPGNRFNPWHHSVYAELPETEVTIFRVESEIQRRYDKLDDAAFPYAYETARYKSDGGSMWRRGYYKLRERLGDRPTLEHFYERLRGFDVVQSWELSTPWTEEALLARARFRLPLVTMVYDNLPFAMEPKSARWQTRARALEQSDSFIVHTERSLHMLALEGTRRHKIVRVAPGVDTSRFSPGPRNRARFGLGEDDFVILFVGWLLPRKGLQFLLTAMHQLFSELPATRSNVRLAIAGDELGWPAVEQLIARLGLQAQCRFLGPVPYGQMPEVYRAADVFVLPSIPESVWQEQFAMALIEAMSCGVPSISTYTGAVPEIAGDAALLCPPADFFSLYEALRRLLLEPGLRREMAARGRERACAEFPLERMAAEIQAVYADVLSKRG